MTDKIIKHNCVAVLCKTLAKMLSISPRTAWRLLSAGKLPKPVSLGGSKRWILSDIELFLECNGNMDEYQARKEAKDGK